MSLSDNFETFVLKKLFLQENFVVPSVFVALSNAPPTESMSGFNEPPQESGYFRVEVASNSTNWSVSSTGFMDNLTKIIFPSAIGSWGSPLTWFGLFTASGHSAGTGIAYGLLDVSKSINIDQGASFAIGDIKVILN